MTETKSTKAGERTRCIHCGDFDVVPGRRCPGCGTLDQTQEGRPKKEGENKFVVGQTIRLPEDRFLEITKLDHFGPSLHYGGTLATRRPGELSQYDYVWLPASFIDAIGING